MASWRGVHLESMTTVINNETKTSTYATSLLSRDRQRIDDDREVALPLLLMYVIERQIKRCDINKSYHVCVSVASCHTVK